MAGNGVATRMLLLGAVALFEPINGYQIRRELLSWQVEKWANVNPGSIYHGLATLARQEHLVRHDVVDGAREVAVYEITAAGRAELDRLMVAGLETVDPHDRTLFTVAFSQLPLLARDEVVRSLERRLEGLEEVVEELSAVPRDVAPPHATRIRLLWIDLLVAETGWLRDVVASVGAGELPFEPDDDWGWQPAPDDPGWQMQRDRERYRQLLGR